MMCHICREVFDAARRKPDWAWVLMLSVAATSMADDFQGSLHKVPYDEEFINYDGRKPDDPITRLQEKIDKGEMKLQFDAKFGYLPSLLEALEVPKASQMLVFSKTSLQRTRI